MRFYGILRARVPLIIACFQSMQRYDCDLSKLPTYLSICFVRLHTDEQTHAFLKESRKKSGNICLQLLYTFVQILFGLFLSQTSINGYVSV